MTPEEHRDAAQHYFQRDAPDAAKYHATVGVLEALLQMDVCGHGTRGFCMNCVRLEFLQYPILVREAGKDVR